MPSKGVSSHRIVLAPEEPGDGDWIVDAACAGIDPDFFFPERGADTSVAKRVCARCPVAEECLEYALKYRIRYGIWGGTSNRERRKIRKMREDEDRAG